ncbi:hypothetical protein H8K52_04745 [Undibacterium seohonense]|uniref:Uncharacterized protein n=1 Tax=Undibacterium seohonense TaxID=1344950 RepID=A0ABR6X1G9_9BURK|nr:hypothetical protein [Undibacterium seohonense]MBC3806652.1 hypothetical protein [Undibacterium seohonense]
MLLAFDALVITEAFFFAADGVSVGFTTFVAAFSTSLLNFGSTFDSFFVARVFGTSTSFLLTVDFTTLPGILLPANFTDFNSTLGGLASFARTFFSTVCALRFTSASDFVALFFIGATRTFSTDLVLPPCGADLTGLAFLGFAFAIELMAGLTFCFATTFTTDLLVDLTAALVVLAVDLAAGFMEALLGELSVLAVFFAAAIFVELFVTTDVSFFAGFFIALAIESNQPKQTSHLKHEKSKSLHTIRTKKQCAFPNSNKPFSLRRSFGLLGGADAHLNNTFLLSTITMR